MVNRRAVAPTRSCRNSTGPGLGARTAIAMPAMSGASTTSSRRAEGPVEPS